MLNEVVNVMAWVILVLLSLGMVFKLFTPLAKNRAYETGQGRAISLLITIFEFVIVYQFLFGKV